MQLRNRPGGQSKQNVREQRANVRNANVTSENVDPDSFCALTYLLNTVNTTFHLLTVKLNLTFYRISPPPYSIPNLLKIKGDFSSNKDHKR